MDSAAAAKAQGQEDAPDVPSVQGLSIHSTDEKSKFPNCYPALNPFDVYRSHLADSIGAVLGIDPVSVFSKLQWTNSLEKGDLVLPVSLLFYFLFR